MPIQEYCKPTAEAFGYIFSLLARLPDLSDEENTLRQIGQQIGAALIAFDCVADWRRDQERGDFNPLAEHDIEPALAFSVQSLKHARSLCEQRFGHDSGTVKLLQGVEQSLTFKPDGPNCLAEVSKPAGIGALLGGYSLLANASESNNDSGGGACCALICCGYVMHKTCCKACCQGDVIASTTTEKDCWGRERVVIRRGGCCD